MADGSHTHAGELLPRYLLLESSDLIDADHAMHNYALLKIARLDSCNLPVYESCVALDQSTSASDIMIHTLLTYCLTLIQIGLNI